MKNGLPPFFVSSLRSTLSAFQANKLTRMLIFVLANFLLIHPTLQAGSSANGPENLASVNQLPPVADFYVETPVCTGANIRILFTGTADSSAVLDWMLDGGVIAYSSPASGSTPAATELIVNWASTGNIDITLTVTDGPLNDQKTTSFNIPDAAPNVTFKKVDVSTCGEYNGGIDLNINTRGTYTFNWTGPNGYTSGAEDVSGLDTGTYEVVVTDLATTCFQWLSIPIGEDGSTACADTLYLSLGQGVSMDTCIGWMLSLPDQISSAAVCQADPSKVGASVSNLSDCVSLTPNAAFSGNDTVCVIHCDDVSVPNYCDTTYFILSVNMCSDFISVDSATVAEVFRCDEAVPVCLSTSYGDMLGYTLYDNGQPYTGGLQSCDYDTTYVYNYTSMPGGGSAGPYSLDYWNFNGTNYSGTFSDPQALANIMNLWDTQGNWTVNVSSQTISGGIPSNSYGNIGYTQTNTSVTGELSRTNVIGNSGTELMLTGGLHEIIIEDPSNQCQDTIVFNPVCIDCPTIYSGPSTYDVLSCDGQSDLCLNVPYLDYNSYTITDNGNLVSQIQNGCTQDSSLGYDYSSFTYSGPYRLLFWEVNGASFSITVNTMAELIPQMNTHDQSATWAIDENLKRMFGGNFSTIYSYMAIQNMNTWLTDTLNLMTFFDTPSDIIVQLDTGYHEIIVQHPNGFCIDTVSVTVNCSGCIPVVSGTETLVAAHCDSITTYCLNILPSEADNYAFTDNGNSISYSPQGCTMEVESYTYDLQSIPNLDNPGLYNLDNWTFNGNDHAANGLSSIDQLVSSMNNWDPSGNWARNGSTIVGGTAGNTYSSLEISFDSVQQYVISASVMMQAIDISVGLDTGFHQLIVHNTLTGCRDTVNITVDCTPEVVCSEILLVDEEFAMLSDCADTASLCIDIPFALSGNYSYTVDGQSYAMGIERCDLDSLRSSLSVLSGMAQLMVTDTANGCQDSLDIMVNCISPSTLNILVEVGVTDTVCLATDELPGNLDSMEDICADTSSSNVISFSLLSNTYCLEYTGLGEGIDSSCIVICDDMGFCDTTYVVVTSTMTPQNNLPQALPDIDTTFQGTELEIAVLANDTFNGTVDTLYIVNQPQNGTAAFNSGGTISYIPNDGYCDLAESDDFSYAICNTLGCDTATVSVYVYCENVQFYTGFSPNGDGKNDLLYIDGLENYPNNRLLVFNRWGNMVYSADGYQNDWDGRMNGDILPDGTYFFLLKNGEGGQRSGYIQIHR